MLANIKITNLGKYTVEIPAKYLSNLTTTTKIVMASP